LTLGHALSDVAVLNTKIFEEEVKVGFWMLEFYAPWCAHCKKLNPILDEISEEARTKGMRIGKVDVTVEKALADKFGVTGYPTLKFRVTPAEDWRTYEGGRTGKDLLKFADRMQEDPLPALSSDEDVAALLSQSKEFGSGVAFVFGGVGVDDTWRRAAKTVARGIMDKSYCGIATAPLSWTGPDGVAAALPSGPFLAVLEAGEVPRVYPGEIPAEGADAARAKLAETWIEQWTKANDHPLVNTLSAGNFRRLGKIGKLLVIAIVDFENSTTPAYIETLRSTARAIFASDVTAAAGKAGGSWKDAKRLADRFVFGHLDGVKWSEFIEQFNVYGDLPRLVVLDHPTEVFYEDPTVDEGDEMETFLAEVFAGVVPAQREGMKGTLNRFVGKVQAMGWRFYLMLIPFVIMLASACFVKPNDHDHEKDE
jgi:protein disulfide-isomerase-like protein